MFTMIVGTACMFIGWWVRGEEIKRDRAKPKAEDKNA